MKIQEKSLHGALKVLEALKLTYKVIGLSGEEYGTLEVVRPKARTRRHNIFAATGYIDAIAAMAPGDVLSFRAPDGTTPEEMQKVVCSRATTLFGSGNYQTCTSGGCVEILRFA